MNWMALFFVAAGGFALAAAFANWEWFFQHSRARWLVHLIGRLGARIFYGALGSALLGLGVLALCGVVTLRR